MYSTFKILLLLGALAAQIATAQTNSNSPTALHKEGKILLSSDEILMSSARGFKGSVVITDKSVLYLYKGQIVSKIDRSSVTAIGTENRGRAYRLIFFTPNQDAKTLYFTGSDNAARLTEALGLSNVKWDTLDGE